MTRLQKLLALLISLSIAIMVVIYGRYILEQRKSNTFSSYQYSLPETTHDSSKQGCRTNEVMHKPVRHNGLTNDTIPEQVTQDNRTNDVIRERVTYNDRRNDIFHEPVTHDVRINIIVHDSMKHDNRTHDAIHKPIKHDFRTNEIVSEPAKNVHRSNDVMQKHIHDATHEPVKHVDHINDHSQQRLRQSDRQHDVTYERPLQGIHKSLNNSGNINTDRTAHRFANGGKARTGILQSKSGTVNDHMQTQITFRRSSLDEPVGSLSPSVEPTTRRAVPTLPTVCTYSGRNIIKVNTTGDFLRRLHAYNEVINKLRDEILTARPLVSPWKPIGANLAVLWGNRDDFLQCLSLRNEVVTVTLPWEPIDSNRKWTSQRDHRNLLVRNYYEWTASEPLCTWIGQRGFTKARWDAVYNRTCVTDTARSVAATSLEPVYLHGKPINVRDYWPNGGDAYPAHFYTRPPDHVFYIHLARDAVITDLGDIISGSLKFLPYACSQDTSDTPPRGYERTVVYGEVFIMTQFWGGAHFHKMLEGFPRLAPYLEFLLANEHVLIHAAETNGYTAATLHFLGLNPERLVTGLCRAKVVYMPQSTPCGFVHVQSTQLLSKLYRDRLHRDRLHRRDALRNGLVLVQRSGTRRFTRAGAIQAALLSVANETGLVYELYPDQPSPSMDTTMRMFAGAALIVAPHGAGLSNLVYAAPGTYVVEAVCNPPHVNMCYQWTAHVLGMRYHALPSRRGCESVIDIDVETIADVVRTYAKRAAAELRVRMAWNHR